MKYTTYEVRGGDIIQTKIFTKIWYNFYTYPKNRVKVIVHPLPLEGEVNGNMVQIDFLQISAITSSFDQSKKPFFKFTAHTLPIGRLGRSVHTLYPQTLFMGSLSQVGQREYKIYGMDNEIFIKVCHGAKT